ncbi:hypothetical protein LTR36_008967 [Oleoguttula mirabilis]|uniref:Uncharacterized protein n=1 Tax=Oleoguttula mirabilis TaxID=1507867 RepID=A0AAV9J8P5_9PEZI|nr:hypothetical protein LTR36_008967 [Oleoguttula mirabilis]
MSTSQTDGISSDQIQQPPLSSGATSSTQVRIIRPTVGRQSRYSRVAPGQSLWTPAALPGPAIDPALTSGTGASSEWDASLQSTTIVESPQGPVAAESGAVKRSARAEATPNEPAPVVPRKKTQNNSTAASAKDDLRPTELFAPDPMYPTIPYRPLQILAQQPGGHQKAQQLLAQWVNASVKWVEKIMVLSGDDKLDFSTTSFREECRAVQHRFAQLIEYAVHGNDRWLLERVDASTAQACITGAEIVADAAETLKNAYPDEDGFQFTIVICKDLAKTTIPHATPATLALPPVDTPGPRYDSAPAAGQHKGASGLATWSSSVPSPLPNASSQAQASVREVAVTIDGLDATAAPQIQATTQAIARQLVVPESNLTTSTPAQKDMGYAEADTDPRLHPNPQNHPLKNVDMTTQDKAELVFKWLELNNKNQAEVRRWFAEYEGYPFSSIVSVITEPLDALCQRCKQIADYGKGGASHWSPDVPRDLTKLVYDNMRTAASYLEAVEKHCTSAAETSRVKPARDACLDVLNRVAHVLGLTTEVPQYQLRLIKDRRAPRLAQPQSSGGKLSPSEQTQEHDRSMYPEHASAEVNKVRKFQIALHAIASLWPEMVKWKDMKWNDTEAEGPANMNRNTQRFALLHQQAKALAEFLNNPDSMPMDEDLPMDLSEYDSDLRKELLHSRNRLTTLFQEYEKSRIETSKDNARMAASSKAAKVALVGLERWLHHINKDLEGKVTDTIAGVRPALVKRLEQWKADKVTKASKGIEAVIISVD